VECPQSFAPVSLCSSTDLPELFFCYELWFFILGAAAKELVETLKFYHKKPFQSRISSPETPVKTHPKPSQGPVICVSFSSLPAGETQLTGFWQRLKMLVSS